MYIRVHSIERRGYIVHVNGTLYERHLKSIEYSSIEFYNVISQKKMKVTNEGNSVNVMILGVWVYHIFIFASML